MNQDQIFIIKMQIWLSVPTVNCYLIIYTNTIAYYYYVRKTNSINIVKQFYNNFLNNRDLNRLKSWRT